MTMENQFCSSCGEISNFSDVNGLCNSCLSEIIEDQNKDFISEMKESIDSDISDIEFEEYFGRSKEEAKAFLEEYGHYEKVNEGISDGLDDDSLGGDFDDGLSGDGFDDEI